jgi:hypothetical protein
VTLSDPRIEQWTDGARRYVVVRPTPDGDRYEIADCDTTRTFATYDDAVAELAREGFRFTDRHGTGDEGAALDLDAD